MAERKSPETESSSVLPKVAPVLSSTSQPKVPPAQVRTLFDWQVARPAPLKRAVKRLVLEAVVEKKLVEVAEVEVALPVMFKLPVIVEEAVEMKPVEVKRPAESTLKRELAALLTKSKNLPVKETVEEALMRVPVVPVALT